MFNNMWDVKEPKHYSKRVGREVPGVVAVLCVVNTGPMLIAVTTITEMVILYKYVEMKTPIQTQEWHLITRAHSSKRKLFQHKNTSPASVHLRLWGTIFPLTLC